MIRTFDDYQAAAVKRGIYPDGVRILYPVLGLAGEAGEVANKVKKIYRVVVVKITHLVRFS